MALAQRFVDGWYVSGFFVVMALGASLGSGCRRKDNGAVVDASAVPNAVAASDGILEGLRQEMATARRVNADTADRVKAVRPTVKCVESISSSEARAHFGYVNSSNDDVTITVSLFNRFWPPPLGRSQPTVFVAGSKDDVVPVPFNPLSATAWVLGSDFVMANAHSTACAMK